MPLDDALRRWQAESWRKTAARRAGRVSVGTLVLCAAAVFMQILRGRDATEWVVFFALLGAAAAAVAACSARPTLAQIAARADERFGLHDLLASALRIQRHDPDPWRRLVRFQAGETAQSFVDKPLVSIKSPARPALALGLSAAGVLVLTMIAAQSATDRPGVRLATSERLAQAGANENDEARPGGADALRGRNTFEAVTAGAPRSIPADSAPGTDDARPRDAGDDARGGGQADVTSPDSLAFTPGSTSADIPLGRAVPSNGSGAAGRPGVSGNASTGGVASASSRNGTPRFSPVAPTPREAAETVLRERTVPDAARDLVRDYFLR